MTTMTDTFDITEFKRAVEQRWTPHALSRSLLWNVNDTGEGERIEVAPVFQEVVGGEQDGMTVWSGFRFDLSGFLAERGVLVESVLAASYCTECSETPYIGIKGTYFGKSFRLKLHLEPIPNTEPVEIIDTIKHQVRDIQEKQP
jgi:hypothetical protein